MKNKTISESRRSFVKTTGVSVAGTMIISPALSELLQPTTKKRRVAMVGTGSRGTSFYGKNLVENYGDLIEYVALCDINPGRLQYAKNYIGIECPLFDDFDEMISTVKIDLLVVTTVDATHHEFIVKGLNAGIDVITEKPMTTDEEKCQQIVDAQRKSDAKLIMAFNYRYGKLFTKMKDMIQTNAVGDMVSIDFNWYLNTYHGASYFRRWHGLRAKGGSLLLHKSAHHFDLINWIIESDPVEVHAYGALEHYGDNSSFRGDNCRNCQYKNDCKFHWDITKSERNMRLYVDHEKHDGYIRDNCLYREEIDIFDKMSVLIKYANNVQVNYSLTTYSPFEGFRIAINGKEGRIETQEGIPWREDQHEDQSKIYEKGMDQSSHTQKEIKFHEIVSQRVFEDYKRIQFPYVRKGHWGGDKLMFNEIFRGEKVHEKYHHAADVRDGAMAVLIGVAARKSIDEGRPIKITELTDLIPRVNKW